MNQYESIDNHHVERDGVFLTVHFDGYTKDRDEGRVIARLVAVKLGDKIESTVFYTDNRDRSDRQLDALIATTRDNLETRFTENP